VLCTCLGGVRFLAEIMPTAFGHLDPVVFGSGLDIGEGLFPLLVGDVLDLIESGNGIADMRGVA
jgi:hypothetical protein